MCTSYQGFDQQASTDNHLQPWGTTEEAPQQWYQQDYHLSQSPLVGIYEGESTREEYNDDENIAALQYAVRSTPGFEFIEVPDSFDGSSLYPADYEICFGELRNIPIRFLDGQKQLRMRQVLENYSSVCICTLSFLNDRCQLLLPSDDGGQAIGLLSNKDFRNLNSIRKDFALRFDAIFSKESEYLEAEISPIIGINVYGSWSGSSSIADALCAESYFLQDPRWNPDGIVYRNPQVYEPRTIQFSNSEPQQQRNEELLLSIPADKYIKSYGVDFDIVLDDFARHEYLSQVLVDARIRTPLMSYQREGLDFILRRESNSTPPEFGLWEHELTENNRSSYRHRITGALSEETVETTGGILADDMGLGKSLTILSAVLASSRDAWFYALSKTSIVAGGNQNTIAAKSTLVIVPSALLIDNWIAEIDKHVFTGHLSYYKYHGHRRNIPWPELLKNDIVLTTYGTVAVELNRPQKPLFDVHWYRIVLDEAHVIRNCSTRKFQAVCNLKALNRWCMSGTPIQNTVEDLGSLVRFIRTPFLEEVAQFRRHITNKIQLTKHNSRSDFRNLHTLLGSICLRRNRSVLPMSKFSEETCYVDFTREEQEGYKYVAELCLKTLNIAVSGHNAGSSHQTVLEAILKLRIFCNNGKALGPSWASSSLQDPEEAFALLQQREVANCAYCGEDIVSVGSFPDLESAKITKCLKLVCTECQEFHGNGIKRGICPLCGENHEKTDDFANGESPKIDSTSTLIMSKLTPEDYPPKLKKLCDNIRIFQDTEKSIVFSFWRKTLSIVSQMLKEQGTRHLQLDGNVPYAERKRIISDFQNAPEGMVLLMTLGVGAVGLNNLSVASQIHILEPQWNPSVESQAIGRVIRLGQKKTVRIIRYLVRRTVERSVRDRQIQKLQLSRAGVKEGGAEVGEQMRRALKELIHPDDHVVEDHEMEM